MSLEYEIEDCQSHWDKYAELHNVSIQAVEAVVTKMFILQQDSFTETDFFKNQKETVYRILGKMQARVEALLGELEISRLEYLKTQKIKKMVAKADAMVTSGEIAESEIFEKIALRLFQLEEMKFPDIPKFKEEMQIPVFFKKLKI